MRTPRVDAFHINDLESESEYDALIAAVGYERRARYVMETYEPNGKLRIALPFNDRNVLSFEDNQNIMKGLGFEILDSARCNFGACIKEALGVLDQDPGDSPKRVLVDVSSFDGVRLATIVDHFRRDSLVDCQVDFVYSLASFSKPLEEDHPNIHVGPVTDSFAGWSTESESPPVAVVGLGYEVDKAIGAVEHIQAGDIFAFIPVSPIEQYLDEVLKANELFLGSLNKERILEYSLHQPLETYVKMETLVSRLSREGSPVIFPFGPKMFLLISLIVAASHDSAAVWRVSSGQFGEPIDRKPSKHVFGLRVLFSKDDSANYEA